jgi:hypothetical protein
MLKRRTVVLLCILAIVSLVIPKKAVSQPSQTSSSPEPIALYEGQILIYLLPQGRELRNQGMDIGSELQTNEKLNQRDFYTFQVFNSKRADVHGSTTIGYFSVNKHTAEIWDDDNQKQVSTAELEGIQKILRQAHDIDASTVRKFGTLRPGDW